MTSAKAPDVRALAQRYTRRALKTLATIMEQGASEQARIAAADKLLDRAHGKPKAESEMPVTLAQLLDDDYGAS
jgi:hypothetical protein